MHIDICQYGEMTTTTGGPAPLPLLDTAVAKCCSGLGSAPLARDEAEALTVVLKAVADPVRLQILSIVRCSPAREVCAFDLPKPLGVSQPTVSHHLKVLTDAGLLTRERRGQWAWFALVPERLALASRSLAP